jgi:hypothetical protein
MKLMSQTRAAIATKATVAGLTILLAAPIAGASEDDNFDGKDFGRLVEHLLHTQSEKYFGFDKPLKESAPTTTGQYRTTSQKAIDQILLAKGFKGRVFHSQRSQPDGYDEFLSG